MFTVVGFYDAIAHAALDEVAGIADPHIRVSVNDIYVPMWNKIMLVYAGGGNMNECRLQSPSLRRMANQRIAPVRRAVLPYAEDFDTHLHEYLLRPRTLDIAEALNAFCQNDGNVAEWVLVWMMDKLEPLPAGEIFSVEGTAVRNDVLGNWVNGALTFTQTLPAGRYALVGMRTEDSKIIAARCVFPDISPRPGCLSSKYVEYGGVPIFRYGLLGNWGEFEHDAPPTIDTLAMESAEHTPEIIMDLIQVRAGRR